MFGSMTTASANVSVARCLSLLSEIREEVEDVKDRYLTNKAVPLEERWGVYKVMCRKRILVANDIYGDGYVDELSAHDGTEPTIYDDFYIERYQTEQYVDLYDSIIDDGAYTSESIAAWQEKVLASGKSSFTYDW